MTCIDIHLSIDPMYLNLAVLFISECPLHFFGKSVSVINSTLLAKKNFSFNPLNAVRIYICGECFYSTRGAHIYMHGSYNYEL